MKRASIVLTALLFMTVIGSMAFAQVQIGVVLPTKDEPRWIQDQNRFETAFKTAGITTQVLFSQGDTAKEKANVESLITEGRQGHRHLPAGRSWSRRRRRRGARRRRQGHIL